MRKQIVIIHGGNTFNKYIDFFNSILNKEVKKDDFSYKEDWKASMSKKLGDNFEIFIPRMPNSNNAKYKEWEVWFNKLISFLNDGIILIGHSLGGLFLAKYLSTNPNLKVKINALILIAPPFEETCIGDLGTFKLKKSIKNINTLVNKIFLIQSEDDMIVAPINMDKYLNELPKAKTMLFKDRGHFNQPEFPELYEIIKSL